MPSLSLEKKKGSRPIAKTGKKFIYLNDEDAGHKSITAPNTFPHLPDIENQNHRVAVLGKSGSGKSYFTGQLVESMNPEKRFVVISGVDEDAAYDYMDPIRLDIYDPETYEIPIEDFSNSVVIFDDIENLYDKAANKAVLRLRDHLLEKGRRYGIDIISITHDAQSGMKTKMVHSEATAAVVFPKYSQHHTMSEYLNKKIGLSPEQIEKVKELGQKSRFVYISNHVPCYAIHTNGAMLFN